MALLLAGSPRRIRRVRAAREAWFSTRIAGRGRPRCRLRHGARARVYQWARCVWDRAYFAALDSRDVDLRRRRYRDDLCGTPRFGVPLKLQRYLVSFVCGCLFGAGLALAGMTRPQKFWAFSTWR